MTNLSSLVREPIYFSRTRHLCLAFMRGMSIKEKKLIRNDVPHTKNDQLMSLSSGLPVLSAHNGMLKNLKFFASNLLSALVRVTLEMTIMTKQF